MNSKYLILKILSVPIFFIGAFTIFKGMFDLSLSWPSVLLFANLISAMLTGCLFVFISVIFFKSKVKLSLFFLIFIASYLVSFIILTSPNRKPNFLGLNVYVKRDSYLAFVYYPIIKLEESFTQTIVSVEPDCTCFKTEEETWGFGH